jgi:hypothetical protein
MLSLVRWLMTCAFVMHGGKGRRHSLRAVRHSDMAELRQAAAQVPSDCTLSSTSLLGTWRMLLQNKAPHLARHPGNKV